MAKHSSKRAAQEAKKRKYLQWGMTLFMGFILTTSLVVFAFFSSPTSGANAQVYNDVSFRPDRSGQYYVYTYEGVEHRTLALPQEVDAVPVPGSFLAALDNTSRVTIARNRAEDPYLAVATQFLSESLTRSGNYAVTTAFTEGEPSVSCEDASAQNPIVLFEQSNETLLTHEGSCLTVEYADQPSIIITQSALLYRVLGIIE